MLASPVPGHSRPERGDGIRDLVLERRGHDDVGALGDEPRRDGTTDAGGAGGDDREAALQESHGSVLLVGLVARAHLSAPAEMPRSKDFWNAR